MDPTILLAVISAAIAGVTLIYFLVFGQKSIPEVWKKLVSDRRQPNELVMPEQRLLESSSSEVLYKDETRLTALSISPKGENIVFGGFARRILLFSAKSKKLTPLYIHEGIIRCVKFRSDEPVFSSCSDDGTVQISYPETNEFRFIGKHKGPVYDLAFHPTEKLIASVGQDGAVRIWEIEKSPIQRFGTLPRENQQKPISLKQRDITLFGVDINKTGDLLATAGTKGGVSIWNIKNKTSKKLDGFKNAVFSVKFDPSGNYLAACGEDYSIRIWNLLTEEVVILSGHNHTVRNLAYHPSGKFLISASKDRTIRIWEVSSSKCWVLEGHNDYIYSVEFHPDGKEFYSVSGDGTLRRWDVPDAVLEILES